MPRLLARTVCTLLLCALAAYARAQEADPVFTEAFDGVVAPARPQGWEVVAGGGWATSSTSPSPGSGGNNLAHTGDAPGMVVTPPIDLSGLTSATLRYRARRSGTYARERLVVTASTDGGASFSVTLLAAGAALPASESGYQPVEVALPAALLGQPQVVLRFEAEGGTSRSSVARIDDLEIRGVRRFRMVPGALSFVALPGTRHERSFTVTNQSGDVQVLPAPTVTDPVFSVDPAGAVTLTAGAAQVFTVAFAPAAAGLFTAAVMFGPAAGSVALTGATAEGWFGFAEAQSAALDATDAVELPLVLDYAGDVPVQGVEFTVSWDDTSVVLVDVARGAAVADAAAWRLSHEASGQTARVVLLGEGTNGLAAGAYAPLLRLRLSTGAIAPAESLDVGFTIEGLIGALAVPGGQDAGLEVGVAAHRLTLRRRRAFFVPSAAALDLGTAPAGEQRTVELAVSNPGGTRALVIREISGTNERFAISPASATIPPDADQVFAVTFAPSATAFGLQAGHFTFVHDGEAPAFSLPVTGRGLGGRGDADGDGLVDVVDLVRGIDLVLGRGPAGPDQRAPLDVYPFPDGDDALDVRDLTVLAQALAGGAWPDGVALPAETSVAPKAEAYAGVLVRLVEEGDGWVVHLDQSVPLRALQLVLRAEGGADEPVILPDALRPPEAVLAGRRGSEGQVRLLLYRLDGEVLPPGQYRLAGFRTGVAGAGVSVAYATAVDAGLGRLPVVVEGATVTGVDAAPEVPAGVRLGAPYPNPFRPEAGQPLRIPIRLSHPGPVRLAVYDVQGRCVLEALHFVGATGEAVLAWDGQARGGRVAAGSYLLRIRAGTDVQTRTVVVVR